MNDAVKQALALYKIQQGAFLDNFNSLSRNDSVKTPWLDRTHFPHYLNALTTKDINGFLADHSEDDTETQLLYEAFRAMIAESFKHAETIPHILRKFLTAHNSTLPDKGMLLSQTSTTVERYITLGWRLFRAILRSPEVLSPQMREAHSRLYDALDNHHSGSEIPELLSFCIAALMACCVTSNNSGGNSFLETFLTVPVSSATNLLDSICDFLSPHLPLASQSR